MTVSAFITRDPAGNPWPPVHAHEASGAIGLIQRLHEAVDHEPELYAVFVNLHTPSADMVVVSPLGLGVVELKHVAGRLTVVGNTWYGGGRLIKAGAHADTPREQVQGYANRIRNDILHRIAAWWHVSPDDVRRRLNLQTAVCFTNPRIEIAPAVKDDIERAAGADRRPWETFELLTPPTFATWVSTLRFGMEQSRAAHYAPYRLQPNHVAALAQTYFKCDEWTEIRNVMPSGQPFAYLVLQEQQRDVQHFPLRTTEAILGRDAARCTVPLPEGYRRVSRTHARLSRVAGDVWIEDLGSTHSTFIDGVRVEHALPLAVGQHITLGGAAPDDKVCGLVLTHQLPSDMLAGATAGDPTVR